MSDDSTKPVEGSEAALGAIEALVQTVWTIRDELRQTRAERDEARHELAAARAVLGAALDALAGIVRQHCYDTGDRKGAVDSIAESVNADAIRLLADAGRIEITHDVGRRVIGRWVR